MGGPLNSPAPTTAIIVGGVYNTVAPAPAAGQACALQFDANGNLLTNAGGGGGAVTQGTSPWVVAATLAAETTKVVGTVNQGTSPWITQSTSVPSTSGGCLANVQQALTTSVNIKGTAGQVYGFDWFNPNALSVYVFIYNTATTPGTIGATTVLLYQKGLPAGAGSNEFFNIGLAFGTGIAIAVSTSPTSSAAPSTGLVLTTLYK